MKFKSLFAFLALAASVVSCGKKEVAVSEKLVGNWTGTNNIAITITDSTGNTVIQELSAPIDFEYLADSTFTAVITINESITFKFGGIAEITDSLVKLTGTYTANSVMDMTGDLVYNEDKTIAINYRAQNPEANVIFNGNAIVSPKQ
ncbi:MAG: hypothetical protein CVU12_00945 [Bacteroidetes bacterium HGW-Bacteroidetes-7]|jgi:hypothetical protein|nr:MAG: hypothetical protein CVU12_00945 [Bacteroidetes bacterium HGW-Bacteroidetes-7]